MAAKTATPKATPEAQLRGFISQLEPGDQKLFRAVRSALRKRLPTANELVHDYGSFLVIAYSPSEHPIEAIVALSSREDGARLYFNQGHRLKDPKKQLQGKGKQARFIPLESARHLAEPDVEALIVGAIRESKVRLPPSGRGRVVIRSTVAGRRPRAKSAP